VGVAHRHIGDVLFSLGDLAGALRAYEAERGVIGRLFAGSHSSDLALQYDLGASHARLASVLEARRDFIGAASEYEACLGIAKRLAAAERNSAHAQLNVAVAYRKLAEVHHLLGNSRQALSELRQGRDIVLALLAIAGTEPGTGELARFDNLISALEGRASTTSVLQSAAAHSGASPVLASALGPARMRIRRDEHQPSSHQN
jgi:hypothetical protein